MPVVAFAAPVFGCCERIANPGQCILPSTDAIHQGRRQPAWHLALRQIEDLSV
jgi:hypothetical protein